MKLIRLSRMSKIYIDDNNLIVKDSPVNTFDIKAYRKLYNSVDFLVNIISYEEKDEPHPDYLQDDSQWRNDDRWCSYISMTMEKIEEPNITIEKYIKEMSLPDRIRTYSIIFSKIIPELIEFSQPDTSIKQSIDRSAKLYFHEDLHPANMFINPSTNKITIIDPDSFLWLKPEVVRDMLYRIYGDFIRHCFMDDWPENPRTVIS